MTTRKNKQEGLKSQANKSSDNDYNPDEKKATAKTDSDTEPDEFLGPNADTDQPIDGEVINDAVLRGEDHADDIDKLMEAGKNKDL